MDNSKKHKNETAQLRLLLPKKWISELDNLAANRFLTRLGLIRFYIQMGMTEDLSQMLDYMTQLEKRQNVFARIPPVRVSEDEPF
jgi:hypothetical protein